MRLPLNHAAPRVAAAACAILAVAGAGTSAGQPDGLPLIRRTEYGVVHVLATDYRGVGIGLGYAQVEDYGDRVILGLLRSKGWMGRTFGRDSMASDFGAAREQARVRETFFLLDSATRAVYDGFAEGVNIYIRSHPDRVPTWAKPVFNAHDAAALDVSLASPNAARAMVLRSLGDTVRARREELPAPDPDDGSNAWAFAPSRTKSGRAILLRNPHLAWSAGYWEAHVTIPGQLDFYGDFRIGSAFAVIGGFNANLGWATTNNNPDNDEVYALDADPSAEDRYLFDGISAPLIREDLTVQYAVNAAASAAAAADATEGLADETRTFWSTPLGPVVHRTADHVYVVKAGGDGEYRGGQEFLAMMRAKTLAEWKAAVAMRGRSTSNLTYADRAGNIFHIWNASIPSLPIASGGDSVPVMARTSSDVWNHLVPVDSLPQNLNPPGGYLQNENDAPYYTNLRRILDTTKYPNYFERPAFNLRGQHAVSLIDNNRKLSLEDVVKLKHSYRMLLADRVKDELLRGARSRDSLADAVKVLAAWDNTVAPESRGGVLFQAWWQRYLQQARDSAYAEKWTQARITATPRGLGKPDLAVDALAWAVADTKRRFGAIDVAWGDVHRVRRGDVDVPVGGCSGLLGCFRVLNYADAPDGKRVANSGDGWVLAVEFGAKGPRAYSVLAYGQSPDSTNAHHADQAAMFARGELKTVRFTQADVKAHTQREYRPGQP
jgi:acyl-homoserine-lactone acylase